MWKKLRPTPHWMSELEQISEILQGCEDLTLISMSNFKISTHSELLARFSPVFHQMFHSIQHAARKPSSSLCIDWVKKLPEFSLLLDCPDATLKKVLQLCRGLEVDSDEETLIWLDKLMVKDKFQLNVNHTCPHCKNLTFQHDSELYSHLESHCQEIEKQLDEFRGHSSMGNFKGSFVCLACSQEIFKSFDESVSESMVTNHYQECRSSIEKLMMKTKKCKVAITCPDCHAEFSTNFKLNRHKCINKRVNTGALQTSSPLYVNAVNEDADKTLYSLYTESKSKICSFPNCSTPQTLLHFCLHREIRLLLKEYYPDGKDFICEKCENKNYKDDREKFYIHMRTYHWSKEFPDFFKNYCLKDVLGTKTSSNNMKDGNIQDQVKDSTIEILRQINTNVNQSSEHSSGQFRRRHESSNSSQSNSNSVRKLVTNDFIPELYNYPAEVVNNVDLSCLRCAIQFQTIPEKNNHDCDIKLATSKVDVSKKLQNTCPLCPQSKGMTFDDSNDLKKHLTVAHFQKYFFKQMSSPKFPIKCSYCGQEIKTMRYLSLHLGLEHDKLHRALKHEKIFDLSFLKAQIYPDKEKKSVKNTPVDKQKTALHTNEIANNDTEEESDPISSVKYIPEKSIDESKKSESSKKISSSQYFCPKCSQKYPTEAKLRLHLTETYYRSNIFELLSQMVGGENPNNVCPGIPGKKCELTFSSKGNLIRHYGNVHQAVDQCLAEDGFNILDAKKIKEMRPSTFCQDCKESFATKELKKMHTCDSILDREGIAGDGQSRKRKQVEAKAHASGVSKPKKSLIQDDLPSFSSESSDEEIIVNKETRDAHLSQIFSSENSDEENHPAEIKPIENLERFICDVCGENFVKIKLLTAHRHKTGHKPSDDPW